MAGKGLITCDPCFEEEFGFCDGCSLTKRFNGDGMPTFRELRKTYSFTFLKKVTPLLEELGALERFIDLHNFGDCSTDAPQAIPDAVMEFFTGISKMIGLFAEEVFHEKAATVQQRTQFGDMIKSLSTTTLAKANLPVADVDADVAANSPDWAKHLEDPADVEPLLFPVAGVAQSVTGVESLPDWFFDIDAEIERAEALKKAQENQQDEAPNQEDEEDEDAQDNAEAEEEVEDADGEAEENQQDEAHNQEDEEDEDAQDNVEAEEEAEGADGEAEEEAEENQNVAVPRIIDIICKGKKGMTGRRAKYDVAKKRVFCTCPNPKCRAGGVKPAMFNGNHCKSRNWKKTVYLFPMVGEGVRLNDYLVANGLSAD